ncbi:hypothetical protein ABHV46_05910 [Asaia sp. BMEF1]|uniref:hypothetical protein n=1 Tax=Asaia sp. BMEF1 TaxID=3155932 RepID=UPI003F67E880
MAFGSGGSVTGLGKNDKKRRGAEEGAKREGLNATSWVKPGGAGASDHIRSISFGVRNNSSEAAHLSPRTGQSGGCALPEHDFLEDEGCPDFMLEGMGRVVPSSFVKLYVHKIERATFLWK